MIRDPYLRKIVDDSGRQEITLSMVMRADYEANREHNEIMVLIARQQAHVETRSQGYLQQQALMAQQASPIYWGQAGGFLGSGFGAAAFGSAYNRCPYCGR